MTISCFRTFLSQSILHFPFLHSFSMLFCLQHVHIHIYIYTYICHLSRFSDSRKDTLGDILADARKPGDEAEAFRPIYYAILYLSLMLLFSGEERLTLANTHTHAHTHTHFSGKRCPPFKMVILDEADSMTSSAQVWCSAATVALFSI